MAERRKTRGDKKGAAEISIRIGTLDPEDLEARLRAGAAAAEIGDTATALREFRDVAAKFEKTGTPAEALGGVPARVRSQSDGRRGPRAGCSRPTWRPATRPARKIASGTDELKQIAAALEQAGHDDAVLDVLAEVAELDPADIEVRAGLAQAYVARAISTGARPTCQPRPPATIRRCG